MLFKILEILEIVVSRPNKALEKVPIVNIYVSTLKYFIAYKLLAQSLKILI